MPDVAAVARARSGRAIMVTEVWRRHLWSAVPHVVVEASKRDTVTFAAHGTQGAYATSRGVPGGQGLSRADRKMEALRTCVFNVVQVPLDLGTLNFFRDGSWARVNLGWDPSGAFVGWYVNFELPPRRVKDGIQTMDLILDALVTPDREWHWKDRDEFELAISEGLLPLSMREQIDGEAVTLQKEVERASGPFSESWAHWKVPVGSTAPSLPSTYMVGGAAWSPHSLVDSGSGV